MSLWDEGPAYGIPDPQQAPPVDHCGKCQGELYGGEQVFCVDGKTMCKECFKDWLLDLLDTSPDLLADRVGAIFETVEV